MNEMMLNCGLVMAGLVMLYFGAEWLVRGSVTIAKMIGISTLVIGLTVVAFGTSAPEMFVGVSMAKDGYAGAAAGNVIGSNVCNILLMLGLSALMRPITVQRQIVVRELPILLVASLVFVAMLSDRSLVFWEGAVLFAGILIYLAMSGLLFKKGRVPTVVQQLEEEVVPPATKEESQGFKRWAVALLMVAGGVLVLAGGAESLKRGSLFLAHRFGVSEAIIGLTLVAIGTSLPEIATSIVASIRKHGDIITGNAIGSCIFNLLAVMGIVPMLASMRDIRGIEWIDLGVMTGVVVLSMPLMASRWKISRWEGGLFLLLYLGYCVLLVQRGDVAV